MVKCTSERIAEELAEEIRSGTLRAGAALPSVDALRARFGAGEYAVRRAVKALAAKGLVSVKRHVGAVVAADSALSWRGRVAFVCKGWHGSYFQHVLSMRFAQLVEAGGWRCSQVFLEHSPDGTLDLMPLRRHIANGLDLVVGLFGEQQIAAELDRSGVPYVVLNGFTREFPGALAVIREETRRCYEQLIAELRRHEVRTVVEFDMSRSIDREFKRQFFESGINVERVMCEWDNERRWHLRDLRGTGHATVAEYFSHERHRRHPPDVVLLDDDYLAAGGIAALYEAGFSIPRDIGVVGYANTGNELVYSFSLTRIENDPYTYADKVAQYVLKVLDGRRAAPPRISRLFVPGDSIA